MANIRSRRDLATLLERQMAAASARYAALGDDNVEARTALKTYLLEAHGRLREEPAAAMVEIASASGLELRATDEPELLALSQGDTQLWLDVTEPRFPKLYTTASAREADRVHEALVHASAMLDCIWIPPRQLEALAASVDGRMVLFSLRHDRRPLRRDSAEDPDGVDFVTLRFWAPSAADTLQKLRNSSVLPHATSVHSARVRVGDIEEYAVAEVFHNGKLTAVGTSFAMHDKLVRAVIDEHLSIARGVEANSVGPRRVNVALHWRTPDLAFTVTRMFSGGEPFRLWGLPVQVSDEVFRAYATDTSLGATVTVEVTRSGVEFELSAGTPAAVAVRLVSALQYHVDANVSPDALAAEPLLARAGRNATKRPQVFEEKSGMGEVARVVLAEACSQWIRGVPVVSAPTLVASTHPGARATNTIVDLARRVMTEAAAYEWHEWLRPVIAPDGTTQWRWIDRLSLDSAARARELARLNKYAQQLVARVSGGVMAPWLQLSLFGAAELVPPVADD